jgi:type I restriction enzyme S subunit
VISERKQKKGILQADCQPAARSLRLASEWKEKTLAALIDVKHGFAFPGENIRDEPSGDILLTPGNFSIGGGFKGDKFKYFDGDVPEDYVLNDGDLIVTMTDLSKQADTLGYPAIVPNPRGLRFLHNQRLGKVVIKPGAELDKGFLFYLLRTAEYRDEVLASSTGTTVKHTSPGRILAHKAAFPPLVEQKAIAAVLGALDDKIELNRKMNETLEAMARALFKSWFVDFDPVRAKAEGRDPGLPAHIAALFPDSFEGSELGEIPFGWAVGKFGDVADNPRRGISPGEIPEETPYIALEHMPRKCIALSEWGTADGVESGKFAFDANDILFGKLRPYFHKVGVAPISGVCSTDILVIVPRASEWFGFVLGHVSSDAFVEHTNAGSTGTKMPRTNWNDLARYPLVLPPPPIAKAFTDLTQGAVSRIVASAHHNRTLAVLRDALLPKLISGELRVADAERIVGGQL